MEYCKKCVMPSTKPNINFDKEGVCAACRSAELKETKIDWEDRGRKLKKILEEYKSKDGKNYDCLVGVSGGKDSHFQVIKMLEYGMNPLCITFTACKSTKLGEANLKNLKELGVDHILFTPKSDVYKKLFRLGLEKVGDPCMPCHNGVFATLARFAVQLKIPLIVWGENVAMEYGGTEEEEGSPLLGHKWLLDVGCPVDKEGKPYPPEEWVGNYGITKEDIMPYVYPTADELESVGVRGIFLGYYLKWNIRKQLEVVKSHGFRSKGNPSLGSYADYENLDGKFVGVHDLLMYIKYGFGRATSNACSDIRYGLIDREEAFKLVKKYDGKYDTREAKEAFKEFLSFLEPPMTEKEFWETAEQFRRPETRKEDKDGK